MQHLLLLCSCNPQNRQGNVHNLVLKSTTKKEKVLKQCHKQEKYVLSTDWGAPWKRPGLIVPKISELWDQWNVGCCFVASGPFSDRSICNYRLAHPRSRDLINAWEYVNYGLKILIKE